MARKVWLETCPGRPRRGALLLALGLSRPPDTAAEALTVAQDEPGHLPKVEEAAEAGRIRSRVRRRSQERPASGGSQRMGLRSACF